jgi:hypothetical protein
MTWDPEIDDLSDVRRRATEREPSNVGADSLRDFGDEPPPAWRDAAPDPLAPIDPDAPVSGHVPPPASHAPALEAPEHDWSHAARLIFPTFRPVGTQGVRFDEIDPQAIVAQASRAHVAPLVDEGPAGLPVVYSIPAGGFDIIVNVDHLLSWGVDPTAIQDAALANLAAWSATAPWTDEASGARRLLSSDSGDGWDAARILLPEVRAHLASELGSSGRVLVGLPERHLLIAGALRPDDAEFAGLFAEFVVEQSGGADEPIDRRVFELVDGRLVEFAGAAPA